MSAKPEIIIRVAVRGFADGKKLFEDCVSFRDEDIDGDMLPNLAAKHATELAAHPMHMIEFEFLDEEDPLERFFRMGTDPRLMVMPIDVSLCDGGFTD